jgi:hypothetical protein
MKRDISPQEIQALSSYLDGQLSISEKTRLEARLTADTRLKSTLEEMQKTRLLLRSLPRHRAPRNFTLSRSMVPARPMLPLFPAFRMASIVAGLLMAAAFMGQFALGRATQFAAPAPTQMVLREAAAAPKVANPAATAVIIIWETPIPGASGSSATGLGGGMGGALPSDQIEKMRDTPLGIGGGPPDEGITPTTEPTLAVESPTETVEPPMDAVIESTPTETPPSETATPENTITVAPTETPQPTPEPSPTASETASAQSAAQADTGSGPILGVFATNESPELAMAPTVQQTPAPAEETGKGLLWIGIFFGLIAIGAGVTTYVLYRKGHP